MDSLMEKITKTVMEQSFSQALEEISKQSEEKQTHFMAAVALLALSYIRQGNACVIIAHNEDSIQIVSSNADEMEAFGMVQDAFTHLSDTVQQDRPEHLN